MFSFGYDRGAVHEHVTQPIRILPRIFVSADVCYRRRIENYQISEISDAHESSLSKLKFFGGHPGHAVHRLGYAHQPLVARVVSEHAREGAVETRMRPAAGCDSI